MMRSKERWYLLRVSDRGSSELSLSLFGALSGKEKAFSKIIEEGEKAFQCGYKRVLLPWNFIFHSESAKLIKWFSSRPDLFTLSAHKKSMPQLKKVLRGYGKDFFLDVILEDYDSQFLDEVEQSSWRFQITVLAHKAVDIYQIAESLLKRYEERASEPSNSVDKLDSSQRQRSLFESPKQKPTPLPLFKKGMIEKIYTQFLTKLVLFQRIKIRLFLFQQWDSILGFFKNQKESKDTKLFKPYICFHFPYFHKSHPQLYSPKAIYDFLKERFYPSPYIDVYNLSIPKDLKLEPEKDVSASFQFLNKKSGFESCQGAEAPVFSKKLKALLLLYQNITKQLRRLVYDFKQKVKGLVIIPNSSPSSVEAYLRFSKKVKASVVIPSYNSAQELVLTLRHLYSQDMDKSEWEVIVVDDGSPDRTGQILKSSEFFSHENFQYIFLPRSCRRKGFADHRFRAGIARNLGVKQAQGSFLFFLDSDILTPPSYLSSVCRLLETEDVVQHPRYHLIPSAPKEYSQIEKNTHTFIKGDSYWENFYSSAENWNQKKLPWKYVSTNTLCLKSSVFKEVGWFRKNYTSYGFEDTDLGYRLFQAGFRFKLNPLDTYHLYRPSEFLNSMELRQKLLGFSAKLFFHNNHCLSGYEEFSHIINKTQEN